MDEYIVIKNGLVLTLDRKGRTGYFNLIVRNGKIFLIDHENKFNEKEFRAKNPEAVIIDGTDKLIMPGLFNSRLISSYSLNKSFFQKCSYENINSWLSLKLVENYLSDQDNAGVFKELLNISYSRCLQNGELYVNESSPEIKKDFFDVHLREVEWIEQYFKLTAYDYTLLNGLKGQEKFLSIGFRTDENINNYSLASIKKALAASKPKLFIDAAFSRKTLDSIKKVFVKPFISVIADLELINPGTIISNPTHLNPLEIDIIMKKKASVLISPSDYLNFSDRKTDLDELITSGINIIVGTGYTGKDILTELKVLMTMISKNLLSSESLLKTAVLNPSVIFGVANVTGSIERNKSADMIMFSLDDPRNVLTLPELTTETVCDFIIQNLSVKDITDVILKGRIVIKDKMNLMNDNKILKKSAKEISEKIYSTGKYIEYKEKYLMRGRVDKLKTDYEEEPEKEEIFVDMVETGEYLGEGEFTILGTKEEEFEKPRERDKVEDLSSNLKEISSTENDLNFFEDAEDTQQILQPVLKKKEIKTENLEIIQTEKAVPSEKTGDTMKTTVETATPAVEEVELQKKKLKFGFNDGEK